MQEMGQKTKRSAGKLGTEGENALLLGGGKEVKNDYLSYIEGNNTELAENRHLRFLSLFGTNMSYAATRRRKTF